MFEVRLESGWEKKFERDVKREINKRLMSSMNLITESIEFALQTLVMDRLMTAPEVQSIASGPLRVQLGLPDGASRIASVIELWADSIEVSYVKALSDLGGILIDFADKDYSMALSLPAAEFTTEKGVSLPWLRWLLLEGSRAIVNSYSFKPSRFGRTKGGIMVRRDSSSWRVPAEAQGTASDNFATRALENIQDEIDVIVRREITKVL